MLRSLIVIIVYYIAGSLGLMLDSSLGYGTAIWPSSGIALVAVLLLGYRFCIAVWIGSFLVNLQIDITNFDSSLLFYNWGIASVIATGAALQSVVGAFLVKRFIDFPITLEKAKDILVLIGLGAFIPSLIESSVGVGTMVLSGIISAHDYPFFWFTWWVGDVTGILIFAPLLILLLSPGSQISVRRKLITALPIMILFPIAIYVFVSIGHGEAQKQNADFRKKSETKLVEINAKLKDYLDNLYAMEYFYNSSDSVRRDEFQKFAQYTFKRMNGIKALEWVPKVSDSEREKYEQEARRDGFKNFVFTQRNENGEFATSKKRREYFPVFYVEPYQGNESLMGYNVGSELGRLQAINTAAETDSLVAFSGIDSLPDQFRRLSVKRPEVVVYKPIYNNKAIAPDENKRKNLKGFAVEIFGINLVIDPILSDLVLHEGIDVEIYDIGDDKKITLYDTRQSKLDIKQKYATSYQTNFSFANSNWRIKFSQKQDYLIAHRSWESRMVLVGGLLITSIFGTFLLLITGRSDAVQRVIDEKAKVVELSREREQILNKIALESVKSDSFEKLLQTSINEVCQYFNFPVGHSFLWDESRQAMVSTKIWYIEKPVNQYAEFKRISESFHFAMGVGSPGMVAQKKQSIYMSDIDKSENFPRLKYFDNKKVDLHSALSLPIIVQDKVFAVVEFFSHQIAEENHEITQFIENICVQLSRIIERKQSEKMKIEFIAMLNQELKTPMNSIKESAESILTGAAGELTQKMRELVSVISQSSAKLKTVLDNLVNKKN